MGRPMERVALARLRRRRKGPALNRRALLACVAAARTTDFIFPGIGRRLAGLEVLRHAYFLSLDIEHAVRLSERQGVVNPI